MNLGDELVRIARLDEHGIRSGLLGPCAIVEKSNGTRYGDDGDPAGGWRLPQPPAQFESVDSRENDAGYDDTRRVVERLLKGL